VIKGSSFFSWMLSYCCGVWLAGQLSATLWIEVTVSVFAAFAFALDAVAPVLPELSVVPFAGPVAPLPAGVAPGAFEAEAEAVAPRVPITSTSLFALALNCESSPCS
jgi:hypothetical protein